MANRKIRRKEKKVENKNETFTEELTITKYIKTTVIVVVIVGLIYLGTSAMIKSGVFDEGYTPKEVAKAVFTYETTIIGSVFNKVDYEYYVAFYDVETAYGRFMYGLVGSYRQNENVIPIYTVDMAREMNKKYSSDESNKNASKVEDLKLKEITLIKIKNGENILYLDDIEKIYEELITKYKNN